MAQEKVITLKVDDNIDETAGHVKSLRTQLREAQQDVAQLSEKFGATSKEAVEAAKKAAVLKDAIGDAKSLTDAFNPDAKFKALSGALTGVAGGFSAVTGALAAFGNENKEVEQAILKVQGAMALASGAQAVGESVDAFKQLGAVIRASTIFQKAATAAQVIYNAVMAANPIGAIVTAVVALIAAGYTLIKMFKASSDAVKAAEVANVNLTKQLNNTVKSQSKATEAADLGRDAQLKMAKASGKSADEIRKLSLELVNQEIKQKYANAQSLRAIAIEAMRVAGLEDATEAEKETAKQALKAFDDANKALKASVLTKKKLIIDNNVAVRQEETDAAKKLEDERKERAKKIADDIKAENKKRLDEAIAYGKASLQAELERQRVASKKLFQEKELADAKFDEAENLKRTERITKEFNSNLANRLKTIDVNKQQRAQELADEQAFQNAKTALQLQALDAASAGIALLSRVFEKNKSLQKAALIAESAIGIAKIIINTQTANAATTLKYALIPGGAILASAEKTINRISAGIGIAANIAATSKGLSALGGGGGGNAAPPSMSAGGGGGGATAQSMAPNFNVIGTSAATTNQIAQSTQNQVPIKAFVVANDVTTQQALDRNIVKSATLG